jgi:hypothetical protein
VSDVAAIVVLVGGLVVLIVLALLFGYDSRDLSRRDWTDRGGPLL